MIPFVQVSGYSNSGKTTVVEKLLENLSQKGYEVATVKHHKGSFDLGSEEKDSAKHLNAGAVSTVLSSDVEYITITKVKTELSLSEILNSIENVDFIIVEGYKNSEFPKIEVYRKELASKRLGKEKNVIGVVSDDIDKDDLTPVFRSDEVDALAEFLEQKFLK